MNFPNPWDSYTILSRDWLCYNDFVNVSQMHLPRQKIKAFCQEHHIRSLAFFGSFVRSDFRSDSDIDVLVEFEPGHVPGYNFFLIEEELSTLLGRKVDLQTPAFLSPGVRQSALSEAVRVYEQA
jgi:predicted nucleotidyltransferase